ncbi:MAG: Hsp20/alpha crystallin family protein [Gammaproteobacteria bacterium]|nr:Hsp20/alpha crystallin family protein [Gammaproteobacteria bacterium]
MLIDKNTVTINTLTKHTADIAEGSALLHNERAYGKASRTISLANEVDESNTVASYVDGVLTLTLTKKLPPQAKRITIN